MSFEVMLIAVIFITRNAIRTALKLSTAHLHNPITNTTSKTFKTSSVIRANDETSSIASFSCVPETPMELFLDLLKRLKDNPILFDLATVDKKLVVLNRTMTFTGIEDCAITYSTTTKSRGSKNIKRRAKVSASFMFLNVGDEMWQVRLFDALAIELNAEQIAEQWCKEPLSSKIRHLISTCGCEICPSEQKKKHDDLLEEVQYENKKLKQPKTYTVMKIDPNRWDFYKAQPGQIGARVQYRKSKCGDTWEMLHISA